MTLWKGKLIWFWLFHIIQYFKCTVCYLCLVQFTHMILTSSDSITFPHNIWTSESESTTYPHTIWSRCTDAEMCWNEMKMKRNDDFMLLCSKIDYVCQKRGYCVYTNMVLVLKMAWCWFVLEKSAVVTQFTDIVLALRWLDGGLFWKSHRRCNCGDRVERVASALVALWSLSPSWFLAKSTRIIKTFEIHSFCCWNITPTLCC